MIVRVSEPGVASFQLRKGEEGLSVFDPDLVTPPLADTEILSAFRAGSILVTRSKAEIEAKGLSFMFIEGAESLPQRLRAAHGEIRPGSNMYRSGFKTALKELE